MHKKNNNEREREPDLREILLTSNIIPNFLNQLSYTVGVGKGGGRGAFLITNGLFLNNQSNIDVLFQNI